MHPDPLFTFSLFGTKLSVYLYGLFIAVGLIACIGVFFLYTKKMNMSQKVQDFTFFVAIVAIAFGFLIAKFYQAIYDWVENGFNEFDFYGAGITAMGGFVGGAAVFLIVYFLAGKYTFTGKDKGLHKKELNKTFCVAPCSITIAHAFGRIGCLMAGCCHGAFLSEDYTFGGIYMKVDGRWGYYVPTQLYESLFLFVLFAVLSVMYLKRSNITMHVYLIAYGVWRIIIEFFRTDYRGAIVLGLAPSQWQSIIFIAGGIALFIIYYVRKVPFVRKPEEAQTGENDKVPD